MSVPELEKIKKYRAKRKFLKGSICKLNEKYYRDECPILSMHLNGHLTASTRRSLARGETRSAYKHLLRLVISSEIYQLEGEMLKFNGKSISISDYPYKNMIINAFKRIKKPIKTMHRNLVVPTGINNLKISVHNGKIYKTIKLRELNWGMRLGSMVPTRCVLKHGKAGKGATQGSKHVELK